MKALVSTPDGRRYGTIVSRHRTLEAAETAFARRARAVARHTPNAIPHLMWEIVDLPTPAGESGRVGERIAIDLSR